MNIKMLALDLDGTLLRDDKTISVRTIRTLDECRNKGVKIVCATARANIKDIVPDGLLDGSVLSSGAVVEVDGDIISHKTMNIDHVRSFLIAVNKMGYAMSAGRNDGFRCANYHFTENSGYTIDSKMVDYTKIDFDPDKIYVITETPESVEFVKKYAPSDIHLFISRDHISFFFHKDAVKSKGVAFLAEHWGLNQSEIAGFGDDIVDLEFLQYCGVGVAVANALDEVKAIADCICDTNENDGVAKWLEENVLCN